MPVKVIKGSGSKPYKIVERRTGRIIGSSKTRRAAMIAASIRNRKK